MSHGFTAPLVFRLRASRRLRRVVVASHLVPMTVVAMYLPYSAAVAGLICGLLLSLALYLRDQDTSRRREIVVLLRSNDEWVVSTQGEPGVPARLHDGAFVTPWLTILRFTTIDGHRVSATITSDNCDPTSFRRLRVRLSHPA